MADGELAAWSQRRLKVRRLQVIFKVVERCNLACSYCYYFFGGDQSYKERPARVSMAVADQLEAFLRTAIDDLLIDEIDIVFHGGEPMLQRLEEFEVMCGRFRALQTGSCRISLAIQTNGTRFSPAWNEALSRHEVNIGVSIDGPPAINDSNRPFHNGKGSSAPIEKGLKLLSEGAPDYYRRKVGSLTVLDAANDYRRIVDYFASDLGIRTQGYLLPDCSHDDGIPDGRPASDYGEMLCTLFDAWVARGDISIREISNVFRRFQYARVSAEGQTHMAALDARQVQVIGNHVLVVHSNGDLKVDDSYIPAAAWQQAAPVANLSSTTLADYLRAECFEELYRAMETPPDACRGCLWLAICGGGDIENRWSSENRFNNPSVFCDALKMFYDRVVGYLVEHGYPIDSIARRLSGQYDPFVAGYAA